MSRIKNVFLDLKKRNKKALVSYLCGMDPDLDSSLKMLYSIANSGSDIIEIGVPFLDPSGDGPIIQDASRRAIENGATLNKILDLVRRFRERNQSTPIVLMSYFNPILKFGIEKFLKNSNELGVDGVLIVDLPYEENLEFSKLSKKSKIDFIPLIAPTSDISRMKKIISRGGGFTYLISVAGVTGTKEASIAENTSNIAKIRSVSNLPVVVGFGIKTPSQAKEITKTGCDGVVVGSAFVEEISKGISTDSSFDTISNLISQKVKSFSESI